MDQKKAGRLLKELRKEKGLTQEQAAEQLHVAGRTVSRWENGNYMPDLDMLMTLSEFYEVDIRELIDGERKQEKTDQSMGETMRKVVDYSMEEKNRLMKKLHIFSCAGTVSFILFIVLEAMGMADDGITEGIASACCGFAFGVMLVAMLYTSRYIYVFHSLKKRLLKKHPQ